MAASNDPNDPIAKESTAHTPLLHLPEPSSDSQHMEELDDDDFDAVSMYPASNYRSMPRSYDLESLTSTRSLYEKELNYTIENGRRYGGQYFAPNDETEQDRLHITHQTYLILFNNELTSVRLDDPKRILDIGTGPGDWAIAMGELYPNAEVIGTDLSAIQPTAIPTNVYFEIDDAEDETGWTFPPSSFDLIHFRNLAGSFASWPTIYKSSLEVLRPGGWIEVIDYDDFSTPSFASYFSPSSPMHNYFKAVSHTAEKLGRPRSQAHLSTDMLEQAGFVDCRVKRWEAPIGPWREDEEGRGVGKLWLLGLLEGFEALGLRLLTTEAGWTVDEVRGVCESIKMELMDIVRSKRGVGMSAGVKVLTGRKALTPEMQEEEKEKGKETEVG